MVGSFRDRVSIVCVSLAFATLAPALARAADMPVAPPLDAVEEERVTFGTGWYLRGDVAAANDTRLTVGSVGLPRTSDFFNSYSVGVGFGYKYNDWLRTDVTLDWRNPRAFSGNTSGRIPCLTGLAPVTDNGAIVGSYPTYSNCYDQTKANLTSLVVLFNGYVDLGTWWGITPYVGAGVGINSMQQKASQNWYMGNQNAYNPTFTDPYTNATYSQYWDQSRENKSVQFAWAAMAGASYAFTRNVSLDVGYRYLGLGSVKTFNTFGITQSKNLRAQEVRVGLRYTPD